MTWTLYCLARYPEYQKQCAEEVDKVLPDDTSVPTYEQVKHDFPVLERVFKEVLRLYPIVPFLVRNSDIDLEFDGHFVPRGTELSIQVLMIHRHPKYWTDPTRFWPERFLVDGIKHPYSYIPFSAGHRSCIGQIFAQLEARTLLSILLKRFEFILDESKGPVEPEAFLTMRPKNGVHLFVRPRRSAAVQ